MAAPRFVNTSEAVHILGLDRVGLRHPDRSLQRLRKQGRVRGAKIGSKWLYERGSLRQLLEQGMRESSAA